MTDPSPQFDPSAALMERCAREDGEEAFSELVGKFSAPVLNFFVRAGVGINDASDLTQEVFIRLWKRRKGYTPGAKFSTYLFTIARSVRIDDLRRKDSRRRTEKTWLENRDVLEAKPERPPHAEAVRRAVAALPEKLRDAVELGFFQNLPYAEVSQILSIPVGTVKSRVFNAVAKLKEMLEKEGIRL